MILKNHLLSMFHMRYFLSVIKIFILVCTKAYNSNINLYKNQIDNLLKAIKLFLDMNNDDNKNSLFLDSTLLINKLNPHTSLFDFNIDSSSYNKEKRGQEVELLKYMSKIKELEKENIDKKTIIEDLKLKYKLSSEERNTLVLKNTALIDKEDQYKLEINELVKEKEDLVNKIKEISDENEELTKINNDIHKEIDLAIDTANNIFSK